MRRLTTALCAGVTSAALAFAPVTTTAEDGTADDVGATIALTTAATGTTVTGTLAFGGAATAAVDGAGDADVAGVGLDVGDVRIEQQGRDLLVALDVLDAAAGEVAPTALYKVDLPNSLSLMAFRGPDAWDYQLADFSDGYTSGPAEGAFDGSTITWTVPASSFGTPGTSLVANHLSSQGLSPGGLASLQLSGFVQNDTGSALIQFFTGGRIGVTVADTDGTQVASTVAFAAPDGTWGVDLGELAPGTYTVTATSAYADVTGEAVTTLVVE